MKIVIATTRPFHLFHLARELAMLGVMVDLYSYVTPRRAKFYRYGGAKYCDYFIKTMPQSIFALQRVSRSMQHAYTEKMFEIADKCISSNLQKCDVVVGLSALSVELMCKARDKYDALTICDRGAAHVKVQAKILESFNSAKLSQLYIDRELKSYEAADYIAIPSEFVKKTFLDSGYEESKLFTNGLGVDSDRFFPKNLNIKNKSIKILYVGGWTYQKGCDLLMELLKINNNIKITHAGVEGDLKLPEHKNFISLGHVSNDRLQSIHAEHDVLILPSRQDGFGMVVLEALASGLPIISSDKTGAVDVKNQINESKCISIFKSGCISSLESVVNSFEPMDFKRKKILSEEIKEKYSWAAYAKRYLNFIESANEKK